MGEPVGEWTVTDPETPSHNARRTLPDSTFGVSSSGALNQARKRPGNSGRRFELDGSTINDLRDS